MVITVITRIIKGPWEKRFQSHAAGYRESPGLHPDEFTPTAPVSGHVIRSTGDRRIILLAGAEPDKKQQSVVVDYSIMLHSFSKALYIQSVRDHVILTGTISRPRI